ncbi:hypothetical protein GCM10011514_05330 [Emticicia aquatilis]|uniref:Uncharacterized protein n=1 Tax=Emticicia aquatilis TaxID=1537369 RepID=A0A917DKX5_9BACT|nr:hypothetical protein GCM10011514_05330 [Emticicia aquatilis]
MYDKYGAMAYGVILQIIPQEELAQEVLVELFNTSSLINCTEGLSDAICIIRNARTKALEFKSRLNALLPNSEDTNHSDSDSLPNLIFNLAFKQGLSLDIIAVKLGLSKEAAMKAISNHVKSFRKP